METPEHEAASHIRPKGDGGAVTARSERRLNIIRNYDKD